MLKKFDKTKSHQRYKLKNGSIVAGITTIEKNYGGYRGAKTNRLMGWARNEAMAGRDPNKVRDKKGDIGSLAHFIIQCLLESEIKGEKIEPDLSEFSPNDVKEAEKRVSSFVEWHDKHNVKAEHVECQRVSEMWGFGGTCDFDGLVDGEIAIVDYKTGGVYESAKIQGAALAQLYFEEFNVLPAIYILALRNDGYDPIRLRQPAKYWNMFYHLLQLDKLGQEIK